MDSRFDGSLLAGSWDRFEHPAPDMFGAEVVTRRLLGASTVGAGSEERTPAQPEPELPEDQQVTEGTAPGTELIDNESLGQESGTDSMTHATSGESCERTPRQAQRFAETDIATAVLSMRSLVDEFSKLRRDMEQLSQMRIRMPDGRLRKLRDAHAHLDQRECNRGLKSDGPAYYCNAVWVLGWTAGEVEQCLQELNGGTSYRTTPLTIVPFDLALRWGLLVVRLLDENEDISVPPRFCGHSRTARRRERRRASKAKSKAIEAYSSLPADGHEIEALQNGGAGMEMQECQALVRRIRLSTEESWHQEVMMVQGAAQQRGNRSFHQWW